MILRKIDSEIGIWEEMYISIDILVADLPFESGYVPWLLESEILWCTSSAVVTSESDKHGEQGYPGRVIASIVGSTAWIQANPSP